MGFWSRLKERVFGPSRVEQTLKTIERRVTDAIRAGSAAAPAATGEEAPRETYGTDPADPILCDSPAGERVYIASLRCPHGHRLAGPRLGSMSGKCPHPASHVALFPGEDPAGGCLVDCYELRCESGECVCKLYFDMYHPKPPAQPAPRGLTRV